MIEFVVRKGLLGGYTVSYHCPRCNSGLKSRLDHAGTPDTCPDCGAGFIVPGKEERDRIRDAESAAAQAKELARRKRESEREEQRKQQAVARAAQIPLQAAPLPTHNLGTRGLEVINDVIPETHQHLLMPGEKTFHFQWMDTIGGCGTTQSAKQFMLITSQRVLYEAAIKEGEGANLKSVRMSGSIPLSKTSFVGTSSAEAGCNQSQGCNPQQAHSLKVNSGGGSIEFPFFSEHKAKRVQRVIEELFQPPICEMSQIGYWHSMVTVDPIP